MLKTIFSTAVILSACLSAFATGNYDVYNLKTNAMSSPTGIDRTPVFQWNLRSDSQNARQQTYHIIVKDSAGDKVWDSGVVSSEKPYGVNYEGPELKSNGFYTWTVTSVDNYGNQASASSSFSTGILDSKDWKAEWIEFTGERKEYEIPKMPSIEDFMKMEKSGKGFAGLQEKKAFVPEDVLDPVIYFRKSFNIKKEVRRAVAYATSHGIYNLYFNGELVSEPLSPGITTYPHYLEYQQYDVTSQLVKGENVLGAQVADGWWTGKISVQAIGNQFGEQNGLLCQLMIEYTDGTTDIIKTDKSFKWNNDGAYLYADITEGEHYDARKELTGWNRPGYDDSGWNKVRVVKYGYDNLKGRRGEPVRVVRRVQAKKAFRTPNGELVLDFGENIVGRINATVTGKKGQTVSFNHQELLDKDGNLHYGMSGDFKEQIVKYTFAEDGTANFVPQFSFQGFRYVKVEGLDTVRVDDYFVEVMNTDMDLTGDFSCSDPMLTQLQSNIVRSQAGNMLSIPTDCPHREKAGWTGDMQIYAATATYNMDVDAFLGKWLTGMRYDQAEDGSIPDVTPIMPIFHERSGGNGCAAWGDAAVIVPWRLYEAYGDVRVLADNWDMMERWSQYVTAQAPEYRWDNKRFQYGEWSLPSIPDEYRNMESPWFMYNIGQEEIATAMYYYSTSLLEKAANVLGKTDRAAYYHDLKENIRKAYDQAYVREDGTMRFDMQGQYVLALALDLVSGEKKAKMQEHLAALVHDKYGDRLNTGFVTTPFLMDVLTDIDKNLAMAVLFQTESPSWLYEVKMGATTMWESWVGISPDGSVRGGSFNHFAYGSVGDYIYRRVLGLGKSSAAYQNLVIDPVYPEHLNWAEGWHQTPYGRASVRWQRRGAEIELNILVPPGCEADVVTSDGLRHVGSGKYQILYGSSSADKDLKSLNFTLK